jgi:hypothetical protein
VKKGRNESGRPCRIQAFGVKSISEGKPGEANHLRAATLFYIKPKKSSNFNIMPCSRLNSVIHVTFYFLPRWLDKLACISKLKRLSQYISLAMFVISLCNWAADEHSCFSSVPFMQYRYEAFVCRIVLILHAICFEPILEHSI